MTTGALGQGVNMQKKGKNEKKKKKKKRKKKQKLKTIVEDNKTECLY